MRLAARWSNRLTGSKSPLTQALVTGETRTSLPTPRTHTPPAPQPTTAPYHDRTNTGNVVYACTVAEDRLLSRLPTSSSHHNFSTLRPCLLLCEIQSRGRMIARIIVRSRRKRCAKDMSEARRTRQRRGSEETHSSVLDFSGEARAIAALAASPVAAGLATLE